MELVWNDSSSILSGISNPYPWASRTLISCEMPDSISGNIDESYHLGIQQQPDAICNQLIQSSFIAHQDPLHQTKQMTGQLVIPSSMDKTAADSPLIGSRSATDWSYASPTEIPDSSTAATDMFISRHEMNQNYCGSFDQAGSSSRNDLMQMCYTYDANLNQLITLQSSIESLDCVLSSDNGGISATSTTEDNMKAIVLSAQNPPQKSTSSLVTYSVQRHGNGTEKYQSNSHSQGSTMKSQAMNCKPKSKPKPKSKGKGKGKTDEANPQLGMHYNYSSSTSSSSCLVFGQADPAGVEPDAEAIASVREMIYRAAAFRPVNLGTEVLDKPMMKRKNIKISSVPQTVAARERRERISDKIKILQKLVPGATKMDTASMLDEAANYLKFLKTQVKVLQSMGTGSYKDSINSMTSLCFSNSNSLNSFSFNTGLNSQNLSDWYAVNKTP